jgi:hypothetical protein
VSDLTVEIQGKRRRIILLKLCGVKLDRGISIEEEKDPIDTEVEWFVQTMTEDERTFASRKYAETFHRNVQKAITNLHPQTSVAKVSRTTGSFFTKTDKEKVQTFVTRNELEEK